MIRPVAPVGGGPPARSPHTSFARSDRPRSPARPRRRPQAPQPGPTGLTPPSHRCKQPSARTRRRPQAPQPGPINVARNSLATTSNFEVTLLELQRFQRLLKLHPNELRAKFWKTVPQVIQQVTRRHERPWSPADTKGRGHPGTRKAAATQETLIPRPATASSTTRQMS